MCPQLVAKAVALFREYSGQACGYDETVSDVTGYPTSYESHPVLRFERLVAEILAGQGFSIATNQMVNDKSLHAEADILATWGSDVRTVVDVKVFRSRMPAMRDLDRAFNNALRLRHAFKADHAIVVTNLRRAQLPNYRSNVPEHMLLGIEDLLSLTLGNEKLTGALIEMDRELSSALHDFDNPLDLRSTLAPADITPLHSMRRSPTVQTAALPSKGDSLATELESVPTGRDSGVILSSGRKGAAWRLFEQVGFDALKYLFHRQFHAWQEQENAGGEEQRFDVLAKVKGDDVFSRMLVEHFRSRFVLFEFKNYSAPVKPNLIHVTEKYLFPTALRSTAIVISPKGLSPDARITTHGALRDVGKLILDLDVATLCRMLRAEDRGTSPDAEMERLLDAFLQTVGR